ncbi:hypothetical protein ERY430_40609 [Erythrobacter sp. EC-HK427]|nr:hypothetical protein ERY430_40609 [Erythrobacter sp. EC-HK427]
MRLRGFIYPGPMRPTFVIPYFGSTESNNLYVQELNDSFQISSFLKFDPIGYANFCGSIPQKVVTLGGDGFMGFVDRNDKLIVGSHLELVRNLDDYYFAEDRSDAFFAIEVMEFRRDRAGLLNAIEIAATKFRNETIGQNWKIREFSFHGHTDHKTVVGRAEVKQVFRSGKNTIVAGLLVTEGVIQKDLFARLYRKDVIVSATSIASLRRFKDDVDEVRSGLECGVVLEETNDIKPGDSLEVFKP